MKNNVFFICMLLVIFSILMSSCYNDKFDEIHPLASYVNTCDTSLADTYTGSIRLIMQVNCVSCHSASSPSGGVNLDNYSGVKSIGADGSLMGSVNHAGGYNAMPPISKIQACETDRLQRWVNAGMPE